MHASTHLEIDIGFLKPILDHFSGVPIFFTISGFLITMSFDKNRNIKKYFYNRFLRIYPALWICAIFTLITLFIFKAISFKQFFSRNIILWFLAEITFFQYYTPDLLRTWGVSAPNGSLWTIPVEIEFYILVPLIFLVIQKIPIVFKLIGLFILSCLINRYISPHIGSSNETIIIKLIKTSLFPHLFNFILGSIIYFLWDNIKKYIENKALFWIALYCSYILLFEFILNISNSSYYPNGFGIISKILLSIMIISLAFTGRRLSNKILRGNDISYGIYIYHMPVINIFVHLKTKELPYYYPPPPPIYINVIEIGAVCLIVICLAYISWIHIEKRALALKARVNLHATNNSRP
jgi:peptidoglycan/LPS O-acetylase OafA/YrhL